MEDERKFVVVVHAQPKHPLTFGEKAAIALRAELVRKLTESYGTDLWNFIVVVTSDGGDDEA